MKAFGEPVSAPSEDTFTIAPPLPPVLVDIRRIASRAQMQRPHDVDAHHLHGAVERDGIDAPLLSADDAGVVDQPGERAERAVGFGEEAQDVVFVAHVALHGDRASAGRLDIAHDRVGLVLGVAIVHDDARLLLAEQPRGRGADAAASSGDDDDLAHVRAKRASATPCSSSIFSVTGRSAFMPASGLTMLVIRRGPSSSSTSVDVVGQRAP